MTNIEDGNALLMQVEEESPFLTYWLPASKMHPMLFYASLFVCSASFETLCQTPLSAMSYNHRGNAIKLINEGLNDAAQRSSDEIVASVITLANFEVSVPPVKA